MQLTNSAYPCSLNVLDIPLDGEHGLLVRSIDAVPDTQAASALGHHHITARHPLDIAAVGQQCGALLLGYVVQMQVAALISEQQMRRPGIQLLYIYKLLLRDVYPCKGVSVSFSLVCRVQVVLCHVSACALCNESLADTRDVCCACVSSHVFACHDAVSHIICWTFGNLKCWCNCV